MLLFVDLCRLGEGKVQSEKKVQTRLPAGIGIFSGQALGGQLQGLSLKPMNVGSNVLRL